MTGEKATVIGAPKWNAEARHHWPDGEYVGYTCTRCGVSGFFHHKNGPRLCYPHWQDAQREAEWRMAAWEADMTAEYGPYVPRPNPSDALRNLWADYKAAGIESVGFDSPFNVCCYSEQCKALEARALAAEAALAAERERAERLHATIRKAHVAMTMACALPGVASEYDFSEAIASTEATLARRAAAIRAEGE